MPDRHPPQPILPSPMDPRTRGLGLGGPAKARITGPNGWLFRYHASYTVGIGQNEAGSLALTRRGIERKARRALRRLERNHRTQRDATTITQPQG